MANVAITEGGALPVNTYGGQTEPYYENARYPVEHETAMFPGDFFRFMDSGTYTSIVKAAATETIAGVAVDYVSAANATAGGSGGVALSRVITDPHQEYKLQALHSVVAGITAQDVGKCCDIDVGTPGTYAIGHGGTHGYSGTKAACVFGTTGQLRLVRLAPESAYGRDAWGIFVIHELQTTAGIADA